VIRYLTALLLDMGACPVEGVDCSKVFVNNNCNKNTKMTATPEAENPLTNAVQYPMARMQYPLKHAHLHMLSRRILSF